MSDEKTFSCTSCNAIRAKTGATHCWSDPAGRGAPPAYCPALSEEEIIADAFARYRDEGEEARLAKMAAVVEGLCYQPIPGSDAVNARWTRVEDTIALIRLMGWQRIGIATCIGLLEESARLAEILTAQGFTPVSLCCKSGSIDKEKLGIGEQHKVLPGAFEPACNPIAQARLLNSAATDMNIIVGLCVGHDMLFAKHSTAPVTTMIAKDRVTGHNPAAVLYGQSFYYKRLQKTKLVIPEIAE